MLNKLNKWDGQLMESNSIVFIELNESTLYTQCNNQMFTTSNYLPFGKNIFRISRKYIKRKFICVYGVG